MSPAETFPVILTNTREVMMPKGFKLTSGKYHFPNEEMLKATLREICNSKHNRCSGRGHLGWDVLKKHWRVCSCVDINILKRVSQRLCESVKEGGDKK